MDMCKKYLYLRSGSNCASPVSDGFWVWRGR